MEREEVKNIIETLLFISSEPLKVERISEIVEEDKEIVKGIIAGLIQRYSTSPLEIKEIAGGYLMTTRARYASWVKKLYQGKITLKLSQAALETLSIVAYKQPISRTEIEEIRGVEVTGVLETLLEKNLIRVCGRKEGVGRPLLYGTTDKFLRYFGLKSLVELPPLEEFVSQAPEEVIPAEERVNEVITSPESEENNDPSASSGSSCPRPELGPKGGD